MNWFKNFGNLIVLSGVFFNYYTIRFLSDNNIKIDSTEKQIILILIQLLIVLIGIYFIRKEKKGFQNLTLLFITFLIIISLLEVTLVNLFQPDSKSSSQLWIPNHKYIDLENKINGEHEKRSQKNKYLFNDINHSYKKQKDKYRLVVLGDSFIWGDCVEDSVIWSRKLEQKLKSKNKNFDVCHWGVRGMSTSDQLIFMKNEGYKYDIDFLIIGFVVNDPDLRTHETEYFLNYRGMFLTLMRKYVCYFWPNSFDFLFHLINNFANTYFGFGYHNWLKNNLYSKENLTNYEKIIREFSSLLNKLKIPFIIIMTPESHNPILGGLFEKIEPIFIKNKISYYNLFPSIESNFKNFTYSQLGATPANGHPGTMVTSFYSSEVYKLLVLKNYITDD